MSESSGAAGSSADLLEWALSEYEKPLMGYAVSILRDVEAARDVVQDTFIRLYRQDPRNLRTALKSWLFTVCRNRALDVIRKEKRMIQTEPEIMEAVECNTPDPAEQTEKKETYARVLRFLDRLPQNQREVIRLRFQQDLSYREISEITNLSVSNVGFLMHTGLKRLRSLVIL